MKAISIRQPWAWLVANGEKDIENRTWRTSYRGPVLIHASRTIDQDAIPGFMEASRELGLNPELLTGGIIGIAEIVDCVSEHSSEWFDGPFGFVMANARELQFFACPGRLHFFDVDYPYLTELDQAKHHCQDQDR